MATPRTRVAAIGAALLSLTALTGAGSVAGGTPLPAHLFAPYFETWTTDGITSTAQASGVKYFTLAFLETTSKTSCTLAWDGVASQPVSGGRYLSDIASLRALGGDVIPSLGGWSADQGGTEIGDSCKNVAQIEAAYEQLVNVYGISRIDMDIEGRSLTKPDGIDRRNKAIALLNQRMPTVQISYTLPTSRTGLEASGLAVLQNAVANGVRIDFVNPMVFDYYDRQTLPMGQSAINALNGLHAQLTQLLPGKTSAQIWAIEGATIMNGFDDYPRRTESTSLADAQQLLNFANTNGMSNLSMWAIQRDNGGCPGNTGANNCSGIVQNTWDFSHLLNPFTR
jgi:Glycosyl hydrolases family 18